MATETLLIAYAFALAISLFILHWIIKDATNAVQNAKHQEAQTKLLSAMAKQAGVSDAEISEALHVLYVSKK